MPEYIDREAVIDGIDNIIAKDVNGAFDLYCKARSVLVEAPTADVASVRHGRWFSLGYKGHPIDGVKRYKCSECGREISFADDMGVMEYAPYCHCGTKMDEGV